MTIPTRTAIIAGNWKMNYGPQLAATFTRSIVPELGKLMLQDEGLISILCPPAISLAAARQVLDEHPLARGGGGAPNMHYEEKGAFNGELTPKCVRDPCRSQI